MLTKILFTLLVIIGVAIFYRQKALKENQRREATAPSTEDSIPTRTLAYVMIALLVVISVGVFAYSWQQNNRIFNIRVTASSGEVVNYQARHKDIDGREFVTMDGLQVTVGQDDKMEMRSQ